MLAPDAREIADAQTAPGTSAGSVSALACSSMSELAIMRQLNRGRGEPTHLKGRQSGWALFRG